MSNHSTASGNVTHVNVGIPTKQQLPFIVRALWFLGIGWWLAPLWLAVALGFAITIIGLPIFFWMVNRFAATLTLQQ